MADSMTNDAARPSRAHYRWPWFVVAAVLAAIALAILWLSVEIERTRRVRDLNALAAPDRH